MNYIFFTTIGKQVLQLLSISLIGKERIFGPDTYFSEGDMTLAFSQETLFKATPHLLPKGTLGVKHEPHWTKGR